MKSLPHTLRAISLFIILSYILAFCLFIMWRIILKKHNKEFTSIMSSATFKVIMTSAMFTPTLALLLLSLIYKQPKTFIEFVIAWLRLDLKSIAMFLLAPIPPMTALIMCVELMRLSNMVKVDVLQKIIGSKSFISMKALRVVGLSYIAGITVNTFVALGEEFGWRAYLMPSLTNYVGILWSVIITGIVWGLWHTPVVLSTKPLLKKYFPWASLKLVLLNYAVSSIIISYPMYLLLISSSNILPPAAFHGTLNALGQVLQFVIKIRDKHKYRDSAKVALISTFSWSVAILITLGVVEIMK